MRRWCGARASARTPLWRRLLSKLFARCLTTVASRKFAPRSDGSRPCEWLRESPQRRLEGYLPFVLAKPYWLRDAATSNPFGTKYFVWMDGGLPANPIYAHLSQPRFLRKLNFDRFSVVSVPYTTNEEIHGFDRKACARYCGIDFVSWIVRGGLFGGTAMAIEQVTKLYATLLDDTLAHGHLGTEETLLTILAHQHPQLMHRRMLSRSGLRLRAWTARAVARLDPALSSYASGV